MAILGSELGSEIAPILRHLDRLIDRRFAGGLVGL